MNNDNPTRPRVPQQMPLQCHACGSKGGYVTVKRTRQEELKGDLLDIQYEVNECPACGHSVLSHAQLDSRVKLTVEAYQKKHGLLTARELVERRKALGFATQLSFIDACSLVALPTLKRIEAGMHVQDPVTDFVLREAITSKEKNTAKSQLFAFLNESLPEPATIETTTKVGLHFDAPRIKNLWTAAALPLAACVTLVASTELVTKQWPSNATHMEIAKGC